MAKQVEILSLNIDVNQLTTKLSQTKAQIEQLQNAQKNLTKSGQSSSEEFITQAAQLKVLQTQYNNQFAVVTQLTSAKKDSVNVADSLNQALANESQTIAQATENNKQLRAIRNQLNASTTEGAEAITLINHKLEENTSFIKDNVSGYEQQKMAIGDYSNQIQDALNNLNPFNGGIAGFSARATEAGGAGNLLTNSFKGMTAGLYGMVKASLAFLATPLGAVIAALGLALAPIINYLTNTQEGIDKVTAVTRPLLAVFQSLIGVLQNVGESLFNAFSNPKKALNDLYEFVKQNLINRFTAFGKILDGIVNLDFKKVTDGVLQAGTGVENLTGKIAQAGKDTKKFMDDAIKKGQELDRLEKELAQTRITNKITVGQLTEQLKQQNRIAEDQTKSLAEREQAAKGSLVTAKEINILKQKELDLEIAILKNKQSRNNTSNAEKEQLAELLAKKNEANAAELEIATTQQTKLNSIRKEGQTQAIAQQQKAVDSAIQKNKDEINLFIASQGIKKKSLEDELAFEESLSQKRLALLDREYKAGKMSKQAYEAEKLNISNDFLSKQTDATINEAQRELDLYKQSIEKKKADDTFYSQEKLQAKVNENNNLAQKETEFQATRLANGQINQQEYNDAVNQINNENQTRNDEAEKLRDEAKKEQQTVDLENQRILDEEKFTTEYDLETERERIRFEAEIASAEKTGANTTLIKQKHALNQKKIDDALQESKIASLGATLGQVAGLLGEESALGKTAALVQAGINVQQGITAGLKLGYPMAIPAVAFASIQGATAIKKITSAKVGKFADGGQIPTLSAGLINNGANLSVPLSNGDDTLAYVGQGEVILNQEQQRRAGGFNFFRNLGVPGFAGGGYNGGSSNLGNQNGYKIDIDLLAQKIGQSVGKANASLPSPIVEVDSITNAQSNKARVEAYANF